MQLDERMVSGMAVAEPFHCHGTWKQPIKVQKFTFWSLFVFFFAIARERIFIKKHKWVSNLVFYAQSTTQKTQYWN